MAEGLSDELGPTGVEPARPCGHKALNLARLPIPPRARDLSRSAQRMLRHAMNAQVYRLRCRPSSHARNASGRTPPPISLEAREKRCLVSEFEVPGFVLLGPLELKFFDHVLSFLVPPI